MEGMGVEERVVEASGDDGWGFRGMWLDVKGWWVHEVEGMGNWLRVKEGWKWV